MLVWLTLLLGVMASVFGFILAPTISAYSSNPALNGNYSDLYVQHGLYDAQAMPQLLSAQPDVAYYYRSYQTSAQLPASSNLSTVSVLYAAGDTRRIEASLDSGRWYHEGVDE